MFLDVPYFKEHRDHAHYLMVAFATITILAWLFGGGRTLLAYITKLDELLLIGATVWHLREISAPTRASDTQ